MPAPYWVRSSATGNGDGKSWTNACVSFSALLTLDAAALSTSGNVIYVASDHVETATATPMTGPGSGMPVVLISSDEADTATPPAYKAGTTDQIKTAASIVLDGSFALYGIRIESGGNINLTADTNEWFYANACNFVLAGNGQLILGTATFIPVPMLIEGCTVDLTADATTTRASVAIQGYSAVCEVRNMTFTQPGGGSVRTGTIIAGAGKFRGCDFSGFSHGTLCEIVNAAQATQIEIINCKTQNNASVYFTGTVDTPSADLLMVNVGPSDSPEFLYRNTYMGTVQSSASVYLDATVETVPVSWKMDSNANCTYATPLYTPWIYGKLATSGSKTFTINVANNTEDLNTAQAFIEVEYFETENSPVYSLATDRAAISAAGVTTGRDVDLAWTGSPGTYEQKLSVTATVGETGLYRARVGLIKPSQANFYVDPKVTVT